MVLFPLLEMSNAAHAEINAALCKGCGTCVGACPSGAMDQQHFKTDQIMAQISAALEDREVNRCEIFISNSFFKILNYF